MSAPSTESNAFRVSELSTAKPTAFNLRPKSETLAQMATDLDVSGIRKLSFSGDVRPLGKTDWQLQGKLGATVIQPCVVTLDPVSTRIDVSVSRVYLKDHVDPSGSEEEMPEDDTIEELKNTIDPLQVMVEALALQIPAYPRTEGSALGTISVTEPGQKPMTDEEAKPFAGLAALKDSLTTKES